MGTKDFYKILNVSKTATPDQIKAAYRKLTLKLHPDRHPNASEEEKKRLNAQFMEVNEAYHVLKEPEKRKNYDKFGTADPQFANSNFDFQSFGNFPNFKFGSFKNFGSENIFGGENIFGSENIFESFFDTHDSRKDKQKNVVEFVLKCTLDDLFTGCKKKYKIRRRLLNSTQTENNLEVIVKPGYKKGTKFKFKGQGDQLIDRSFQDVHIVLDEVPDPLFTRNGNDLEMEIRITFKEFICGFSRNLILPGKRRFRLEDGFINKIGDWCVINGLGMPLSKEPSRMGNLKVKVLVEDIPKLTPFQRQKMASVL